MTTVQKAKERGALIRAATLAIMKLLRAKNGR